MAGSFKLPEIADNNNGWGPVNDILLEKFRDIPYAPYSKADKLGRVADWSAPEQKEKEDRQRQRAGYRNYRDQYQAYGSGASNAFAYFHAEDEASFSVVDNRSGGGRKLTRMGGRGARGGGSQFQRNTPGGRGQPAGRGAPQGRRRFGWKDYDKPHRTRDASVNIGPDWKVLEEIDMNRLGKLNFTVPEPEDLAQHGFLFYYDKSFDRVSTKSERPLQVIDRVRYNPTTSDDPVILDFADQNKGSIFTTDTIISLLMCASRSVYPWDIVVNKQGDKLFLDKREGGPFDYVTVNENTSDPPMESSDKDNINSPSALSLEATYINQNFAFQVVKEDEKYELDAPNPFYSADETDPAASCGYRYRRWDLSGSKVEEPESDEDEESDEEVAAKKKAEKEAAAASAAATHRGHYLVIRTEVDAALQSTSEEASPTFITIKALNEFDPRAQGAGGALDWRSKLDTQRGAVVATEMKNNSLKLARWAVQSVLAGAEQMKLGYVSRNNPKEHSRHTILGAHTYKPRDFAAQMNINLANGWGIVRTITDICLKLPDGKYVLVKDPNKAVLRLYEVPASTFVDEDSHAQPAPTRSSMN